MQGSTGANVDVESGPLTFGLNLPKSGFFGGAPFLTTEGKLPVNHHPELYGAGLSRVDVSHLQLEHGENSPLRKEHYLCIADNHRQAMSMNRVLDSGYDKAELECCLLNVSRCDHRSNDVDVASEEALILHLDSQQVVIRHIPEISSGSDGDSPLSYGRIIQQNVFRQIRFDDSHEINWNKGLQHVAPPGRIKNVFFFIERDEENHAVRPVVVVLYLYLLQGADGRDRKPFCCGGGDDRLGQSDTNKLLSRLSRVYSISQGKERSSRCSINYSWGNKPRRAIFHAENLTFSSKMSLRISEGILPGLSALLIRRNRGTSIGFSSGKDEKAPLFPNPQTGRTDLTCGRSTVQTRAGRLSLACSSDVFH
ncbi:hypothetical protein J6590_081001 [Homalodisca vitripennis]|nr:hypothetical protein J6590_081001 [Homalodisca vitripennis]